MVKFNKLSQLDPKFYLPPPSLTLTCKIRAKKASDTNIRLILAAFVVVAVVTSIWPQFCLVPNLVWYLNLRPKNLTSFPWLCLKSSLLPLLMITGSLAWCWCCCCRCMSVIFINFLRSLLASTSSSKFSPRSLNLYSIVELLLIDDTLVSSPSSNLLLITSFIADAKNNAPLKLSQSSPNLKLGPKITSN